jgi:hypothetical protein
MQQRHITRPAMVGAFAVAVVLAAMGGSAAGQDEMAGMDQAGMATSTEEGGMMAMHNAMHAKMEAMDQELDALVVDMNSADPSQKVDAVAAVVAELVGQRKVMHEMTMKMGSHMMEHMRSGMAEGMMGDCPMMRGKSSADEQAEEGDHSAHHPED